MGLLRLCEDVIIRSNPEQCQALDRHRFSITKIFAMTILFLHYFYFISITFLKFFPSKTKCIKPTDKPDSVWGNHLSRRIIANTLKRHPAIAQQWKLQITRNKHQTKCNSPAGESTAKISAKGGSAYGWQISLFCDLEIGYWNFQCYALTIRPCIQVRI